MAKARKLKTGGKVPLVSGNPKVAAEAKERKDGGRAFKDGGKVEGFKSGGRMDKFARGGRAGSDKSPFSSAKMD